MSLLHVRVGADGTFVFESPLGDPFRLDLAVTKSKRQPADEMFSSRHPLSNGLVQRIKKEVKMQESGSGFLKQFVLGIFLPSGLLLGGTWNMDRDVDVLRREVAQVLSRVFLPDEYTLEECITEGTFTEGRVLLRLRFN